MSVRVNSSFSAPLPVHGGCPQGSLLGVFLFNVSTDKIEIRPPGILEEVDTGGEDAVLVGDFFDSVDRQFLRENESQESYETSNIVINNSSDLLPSVSVSVSLPPSSLESDFEPFLTSCLLYTSPSPRD